ncbi:hypothetical protein B0O99DRAFT_618494 [Bisporella sp. PMI_857]|nr:hypothetical protein B0O99DRAFT_618494 [Bisporella sp. PMI_857]
MLAQRHDRAYSLPEAHTHTHTHKGTMWCTVSFHSTRYGSLITDPVDSRSSFLNTHSG